MYLVEYCKGQFINAERIEEVSINEYGASFVLTGVEMSIDIDREYVLSFLNQVSAFDENFNLLEASYKDFSLKN